MLPIRCKLRETKLSHENKTTRAFLVSAVENPGEEPCCALFEGPRAFETATAYARERYQFIDFYALAETGHLGMRANGAAAPL